ncbi:MAG: glycosyltransferase family 25 protein [Rhizorhabdus sp.]|nr:MAG: glycosyltransferase family 25 protein [Rhizorhabdus sp.]
MTPAERLFQSFDRVYVLNLPDRADRRAEMAGELAAIGTGFGDPRIRLFPAIRPEDAAGFPGIGARGCFLSHLAVLREARDEGFDRILILEDDCDFAAGIGVRLPAVLDALDAQSWDIVYGGYDLGSSPIRDGSGEEHGALIPAPPTLPVRTTHCIGFRRAAIEALIPYLEAMLDRPAGSADGGPMHVDGAYGWFRASRPDLACWLASPRLGRQRPSRTDIAPPGPLDRLPGPLRRAARGARRWLQRRFA